jgi:hypothetical protein
VIDLSAAGRQQNEFSRIGWTNSNRSEPQTIEVSLQLDRNLSKDLVKGEKIVTSANMGKKFKRQIRQVARREF